MKLRTSTLLVLGLFSLASCGTSIKGFCDDVCECTGCSDEEREECVDSAEDAEDAADERGCSKEFNEALSCSSDELECKDKSTKIDGCEAEYEELAACTDGEIAVPTGGNDCTILANELRSCCSSLTCDSGRDGCESVIDAAEEAAAEGCENAEGEGGDVDPVEAAEQICEGYQSVCNASTEGDTREF